MCGRRRPRPRSERRTTRARRRGAQPQRRRARSGPPSRSSATGRGCSTRWCFDSSARARTRWSCSARRCGRSGSRSAMRPRRASAPSPRSASNRSATMWRCARERASPTSPRAPSAAPSAQSTPSSPTTPTRAMIASRCRSVAGQRATCRVPSSPPGLVGPPTTSTPTRTRGRGCRAAVEVARSPRRRAASDGADDDGSKGRTVQSCRRQARCTSGIGERMHHTADAEALANHASLHTIFPACLYSIHILGDVYTGPR
mmetsp:Transcript_52321/g.137666  ORF Transcript_52321/g.137666 Transcript_52321/m.137666 type:complete len:258 (+) Transcript_52321:164-937(+)